VKRHREMEERIGSHRRGGFSLLEIMVAMVILAICIIFTAVSITQSRKALRQAEYVQTATSYATNLIEEIKTSPPKASTLPVTDIDGEVKIGTRTFHVVRSVYLLDTCNEYSSQQIVVNITWGTCARPLVFSEVILAK